MVATSRGFVAHTHAAKGLCDDLVAEADAFMQKPNCIIVNDVEQQRDSQPYATCLQIKTRTNELRVEVAFLNRNDPFLKLLDPRCIVEGGPR